MNTKALVALLLAGVRAGGCAELKEEDIRQIYEVLRQLRGKQPAPPPPSPPPATEMPAPAAAGLTFTGNCVGRDEGGYLVIDGFGVVIVD